LSEGLKQYNARHYHAAAELFNKAEQGTLNNQQIHLYTGRTLEKLKDLPGTLEEYCDPRISPTRICF